MLPAAYQLPAAIVLLLGGIVACFFGYRLFRIVLAIFGFILGALAASSIFGVSDTWPMVIAAVVGGLLGAGVLIAAYFVGVALIGAGLGAVVANLLLTAGDRDPHFLVVVFASITGAAASMYLQRYFIIVGTGFGGAWTMICIGLVRIGVPWASFTWTRIYNRIMRRGVLSETGCSRHFFAHWPHMKGRCPSNRSSSGDIDATLIHVTP